RDSNQRGGKADCQSPEDAADAIPRLAPGPVRARARRECHREREQGGGRGSTRYRVPFATSSAGREGLRLAAQGRRPLSDRKDRASGFVKDLRRPKRPLVGPE